MDTFQPVAQQSEEAIVYGKGESIMVLFDYKENKPIPIPKDFLEKIVLYREQEQ